MVNITIKHIISTKRKSSDFSDTTIPKMNVIIVEPTLIIELLTENIVALTSEFFNFEFNSALKRTSNTPHMQ